MGPSGSGGKNDYGQLGDGTTANRALPVQVEGIDHAKAVAAGMFHTVLLKDDGTVWTWGYNGDGQIGDDTYHSTTVPVQVNGLENVIAIASGGSHSFALNEDGSVWVWGRNVDGQLGDGTPDSKGHPIMVEGITKAESVGAGRDFGFAITQDGTVWGWGSNYRGQLGLGTNEIYQQKSPMIVEKLTDVAAIDGGELHAVVLKKDGTVWGMGKNADGQLGNGGGKEVYGPVKVNDLNIGKPTPAPSPQPSPTPSPAPSPLPSPSPVPSPSGKTIQIDGGLESISVLYAEPESVYTLIHKSGTTVTNYGSAEVNPQGMTKWNNIPAGDNYYVYDAYGRSWGPLTATGYPDLKKFFVKDSIKVTTKHHQQFISLSIQGEVVLSGDSDEPFPEHVIINIGSETVSVPLEYKWFKFTKMISFTKMPKTVTISGDGRGLHGFITIRTDHDLIDDSTVIGEEAPKGTWNIKGAYAPGFNATDLQIYSEAARTEWKYLQDLRVGQGVEFGSERERRIKENFKDFQVKFIADKNMKDVSLYVTDDAGGFEIVPLWPTFKPALPKTIELQLDSESASVSGNPADLEASPYIHEGSTMVPIRFISEALGAAISWNSETRTVTLKTDADQIELGIDRKEAVVNGRSYVLSAPATLKDGVTMVPLRFVSEQLKMNVFFSEGHILITDVKDPGYPYTQTGKPQ